MKHTPHGYWLEEAGAVAPAAPLEGDIDADVVVIGGGFTGLWAAWHLKQLEPEARIVLLEADGCGRGPSGRNGGFCNVMWFSAGEHAAALGGRAGAGRRPRRASAAWRGSAPSARRRESTPGSGRAATCRSPPRAAHDDVWAAALAACRELGVGDAVRPLSPAEVAARCASPAFRAGAFYPSAATVQPARLALGLRERLLARGVELFESTPVRALRDAPDGVEARTPAGTVRAGAAVLAIGGAARRWHGPLRNRLSIASSHIVLTEPVPELLEEIGWTGGECIIDAAPWSTTSAPPRTGASPSAGAAAGSRWAPAWAAAPSSTPPSSPPPPRTCTPSSRASPGARITHAWGGPIDASPTHLPMVVPLPGGRAFAAAGYTGNGVGPSHMVGRTLASLALDRRDEPSRLAFVDPSPPRVPPEPFQWIGGEAIRAGLMAKEEAELAGRRPRPHRHRHSAVPELIGFHIGR